MQPCRPVHQFIFDFVKRFFPNRGEAFFLSFSRNSTVFWALAVNWEKLSAVIRSGAFLGIAMIVLVAVLVWGCVAPPVDGYHYFEMLGVRLSVSNFTGKLVYVVGLVVIMFAAGSAQLSGMFDGLVCFAGEEEAEVDHGHDDHGHH